MLQSVSPNPETDSRLAYSQGMLSRGETRTLFISGQVGVDHHGIVSPVFEDQVRQAWANLLAVLGAANMQVSDLAKLTVYLTSRTGAFTERTTMTDAFGHFAVTLPDGDWAVKVKMLPPSGLGA